MKENLEKIFKIKGDLKKENKKTTNIKMKINSYL